MAEYKNADEIVKNMTKKFDKKYGDTTIKGIRDVFNMCVNCVNQTPTADAVEVKHGKWVSHHPDGSATCSVCGRKQKDVWDFDNWQNYCGHCGADMRGVEK